MISYTLSECPINHKYNREIKTYLYALQSSTYLNSLLHIFGAKKLLYICELLLCRENFLSMSDVCFFLICRICNAYTSSK